MKRFVQLTLASFIALLGLGFTPLAPSVGAIDLFSGACGGDSGTTGTSGTTNGTQSGTTGTTGTTSGTSGTSSTGSGGGASSICGAAKQDDLPKIITNVINAILFALGIAAVVMIILGGIRYTTSNGDSGSITSAKNTILYAVVGLVVALMAFLIVNFVIDKLG